MFKKKKKKRKRDLILIFLIHQLQRNLVIGFQLTRETIGMIGIMSIFELTILLKQKQTGLVLLMILLPFQLMVPFH